MNDFTRVSSGINAKPVSYNDSLRAFMMSVYNHMATALAITGLIAYFVGTNTQIFQMFYGTPVIYVIMFAPVVLAMVFGAKVYTMSPKAAAIGLYSFAALMGISTAYIFMVYTAVSIASTFFMTASIFGGMSLYGYTTKKDLTSWGSFLVMGMFAAILVSVVNIFLKSPAISYAVSYVVVFLVIGLTAYDTQKLKQIHYQVSGDRTMVARASIAGAFSLYLDFLNLFIQLLRLFGNRK
ncbi:MAG: Bax inhibitor-1/YccA family protein [Alphaproteobacteria bacterium]|nr:Bax inhibitor-1/YccA family protein [Alphaproteobacteria bacterium]